MPSLSGVQNPNFFSSMQTLGLAYDKGALEIKNVKFTEMR